MSVNLHTLAGAYALDALTDVERRRFETHLIDCDACADEVRGMRETTARLAVAVSETPPLGLRDAVFAEVVRTRQLPPRLARPPVRRIHRVSWMLSAACLILAAVLGVAALQAQRASEKAAALNRAIAAVITAPDAHRVTGAVKPAGSGTVIASRSLGKAVITMSGLPPLPSAKAYELWYMGPSAPRPLGTMRPAAGRAPKPVLANGLGDATQVGVTVEPAGGSDRPTTTPVFAVSIS